jgi:hypothetical protein
MRVLYLDHDAADDADAGLRVRELRLHLPGTRHLLLSPPGRGLTHRYGTQLVTDYDGTQLVTDYETCFCGSGMFIQDPTFFHPGPASKNLSILTQKWFLSSRKYVPGC